MQHALELGEPQGGLGGCVGSVCDPPVPLEDPGVPGTGVTMG